MKTDRAGGNVWTAHSFFHLLVHWHFSLSHSCRCGPFSSLILPLVSGDQLGTWWGCNLSESEDNTQVKEMERQQKCTGAEDLLASLDGTGSMGLGEMAPPAPAVRLLISASAASGQWSAQSWRCEM